MGPTWNKAGEGALPKDHWIHKAAAKEKARIGKKGKKAVAVKPAAAAPMMQPPAGMISGGGDGSQV